VAVVHQHHHLNNMIIPLEVIFHWPAPNYINPDSRGPALWIVSAIFLTAATFSVGVRLWTRIFIRKWFGPDDLLIVLAYVCLHYLLYSVLRASSVFDLNADLFLL
jgi:hypothetical protein